MEVTALCFMLLMLEVPHLKAQVSKSFTKKSGDEYFLGINPNRLQHFLRDPVSFDCGGSQGSTKFRLLNSTKGVKCSTENMQRGSICTVFRIYPGDSGRFWCEIDGGERSNTVNLTVTDGAVILESPALPVREGDSVTMRCRNKTSSLPAEFYKDNVLILGSPAAEMTINNVSKSDEGVYKCNIVGVGGSPGSLLTVRASITSGSSHKEPLSNETEWGSESSEGGYDDSDPPSYPSRFLILLWVAFTILMVALVLAVVGFLHLRKRGVVLCLPSKTPKSASHSGKDNQTVFGEDAEDSVTYAVVVTNKRENNDTADAGVNLGLETSHSRKPQRSEDEDESSEQPVYSALAISETPHALTHAANDSSLPEQELLYSLINKA